MQEGIRGKLRYRRNSEKKKAFWEYAEDKYDKETISDLKAALKVYKVFMYVTWNSIRRFD